MKKIKVKTKIIKRKDSDIHKDYPITAEETLKIMETDTHSIWEQAFAKRISDIWNLEYPKHLEIVLKNQPNLLKGMRVNPEDEGKIAVPNVTLAHYVASNLLEESFDEDMGIFHAYFINGKGFYSAHCVKEIREKINYTNK
jgi:hypothetical protein